MVITICGSMEFADKMLSIGSTLEGRGHRVLYPKYTPHFAQHQSIKEEKARLRNNEDLIRSHYENIEKSDAILVLNFDKGEHKRWIGANSFLEMGFAHILGKRIYLLKPIPQFAYFQEEIKAMQPTILDDDLAKILLTHGLSFSYAGQRNIPLINLSCLVPPHLKILTRLSGSLPRLREDRWFRSAMRCCRRRI